MTTRRIIAGIITGLTLIYGSGAILSTQLATATANAYTPTQLHAWQQVATAYWGGACAGRYHPTIVHELPNDGENLKTLGQAILGDTQTCSYDLIDNLDPYDACVVTVHEAGHLAGHQHQVGTIMDPEAVDALPYPKFRPCASAVPLELTRDQAWNYVDTRWPMQTLDCRRSRLRSREYCWGHTILGHRARFMLRLTRPDYRVRTVWKRIDRRQQ